MNPCSLSGRNTYRISSSPITKTGIDRPISTRTLETRSNTLRALVALMMPTEIPRISHRTIAPMTTDMVGGASCLIIVSTDSWVKYE